MNLRRQILAVLGVMILLTPAGPAGAADLLVTNLSEFNAAVPLARAGDTIILANGTWTNVDLLFKGHGTAARPITLRAQDGGQVFLTGSSRLRLAGSHLVVQGLVFKDGYRTSGDVIAFREGVGIHASFSRVRDCEINEYNPPLTTSETKWVSVYGISNRVDHCYFNGKRNGGTLLAVWLPAAGSPEGAIPNHNQIDHNWFSERPVLGGNGGEIIRIGDSATSFNISRTVVEHNYFTACRGDIEIISSKSCENIYRYNTFADCEGALTFRHGNRCIAEGNFFLGNHNPKSGGVRIIGEGHKVINNYFQDLAGKYERSALTMMQGIVNTPLNGYFQVKNCLVAFNTFVNCANSLLIGREATLLVSGVMLQTTLPPTDCTIANNIVFSTNDPLVFLGIPPVNLTWQGNIMFGAPLGISQPAGITLADPMLERGVEQLWRPAVGSPVLGAAQGGYSFLIDDIKGRPRGAVKDIGCDQLSYAPALRSPLSAADVGPGWRQPHRINVSLVIQPRITLRWPGAATASYQVQASSNLADWEDCSPLLPAEGETQIWEETPAAFAGLATFARFYRVKQVTGETAPEFSVTASVADYQAIAAQVDPQGGPYYLQTSTDLATWQNVGATVTVSEQLKNWETDLKALPELLLPTRYLRVKQLP